jgi:hypothetical protein
MTFDHRADPSPDQLADLVRHLHRVFLSREPEPEEIAGQVECLQSGSPLAAVNNIILSEEAAAVRAQRHKPEYSGIDEAWLLIRREDVMQVLTKALTLTRQDQPSTDEIMLRFDEFCRGTGLATILKDTLTTLAPPVRFSESQDAIEKVVRTMYRLALGRMPGDEEVANWSWLVNDTGRLSDAVLEISGSEEAALVRARRHEQDDSERGEGPLIIKRDDVIQVLTQALVLGRQDQPSADEIMRRLDEFRGGTDLATILKDMLTAPVRVSESQDAIDNVVRTMYRLALGRLPGAEEVTNWSWLVNDTGRLSDAVLGISGSEEAKLKHQPNYADGAPGALVQIAFEILLGRGASAHEVDVFRARIEGGDLDVSEMVMSFFNDQARQRLSPDPVANDPDLAYLFGSRGVVSASDCDRDAKNIPLRKIVHDVLGRGSVFKLDRSGDCTVSIITSLYRGGDFIRSFLQNITSQTIFRSHCELIIIDANSPDGEHAVIDEYRKTHPNIVYKRMDSRIGIYEAWNIGVALARGKYLTNANLDDYRRSDSLEIQAAVLDSLDFVDVTYQEVLYSFKPRLSFDEIAAYNFQTALPIVSRYNLMEFNSPHNAPMWRKSLHDDVGLFNSSLKSASDFEFWIRCRAKDKVFYKVNDPHVAYYVNPKGISTRPDTRGLMEANAVSREYYRKIVSPLLTISPEKFLQEVDGIAEAPLRSGRRYDIVQSALRAIGSASRLPSGGDTA